MDSGRILAIVPVRDRRQAKKRLAPILSADERAGLAHAMAEDVLAALAAVRALDGIVLVTRDREIAGLAARAGAHVLRDGENGGINAAIDLAARLLIRQGNTGMLVVPADVPLISATEIEAALAAHRSAPAVTLVPAAVDMGTNGLLCSPVDVIAPQFGPQSFIRHRDSALAIGLQPQVLAMSGWGRDIDRPADLLAFAAAPSATRSYAFLRERGIAERLRPGRDGDHPDRQRRQATG